ncbi:hypothetical protein [Streptomyces iakyrus]
MSERIDKGPRPVFGRSPSSRPGALRAAVVAYGEFVGPARRAVEEST